MIIIINSLWNKVANEVIGIFLGSNQLSKYFPTTLVCVWSLFHLQPTFLLLHCLLQLLTFLPDSLLHGALGRTKGSQHGHGEPSLSPPHCSITEEKTCCRKWEATKLYLDASQDDFPFLACIPFGYLCVNLSFQNKSWWPLDCKDGLQSYPPASPRSPSPSSTPKQTPFCAFPDECRTHFHNRLQAENARVKNVCFVVLCAACDYDKRNGWITFCDRVVECIFFSLKTF